MMKKVFLLAIIVVLAASILFISGCGLFGAGDLFQLDIEKVPNAPASLSSGINSRALSLGSINEYEGTFFGNFSYVYQATTNYNSSKEHIEYLRSTPERFINIEEVDVNGYTEKLTFTDENGSMNGIIYQNTDLTQWSAVKLNYDGELRQFNYLETDEYRYAGLIFYRKDLDNMIDVTEVWEYNDKKEVNVSRIYNIGEANFLKVRCVAITELLSGNEKTTALLQCNSDDPLAEEYDFSSKDKTEIGVIDLTMSALMEGAYSTENVEELDSNYSEFPNLDEVEAVAPKSILPNQLLDISFDTSNLDRYSGLDK